MKQILAGLALAPVILGAAQAQSVWVYLECDLERRTRFEIETNIWDAEPQALTGHYRLRVAPQPEIWVMDGSFAWQPVCGPNAGPTSACALTDTYISRANTQFIHDITEYGSRYHGWEFGITRNTLTLNESVQRTNYDDINNRQVQTHWSNTMTRGQCEVGEDPVANRPAARPNRF